LHRRYGHLVEFLAVYVREAHPIEGWRMDSNDQAGIAISQPRDLAERRSVASQCTSHLSMAMPLVVDDIEDRVGHLYSGMPDRLYLVDRTGRVAYKSGRGPFGFRPQELEQSLLMLLIEEASGPTVDALDDLEDLEIP